VKGYESMQNRYMALLKRGIPPKIKEIVSEALGLNELHRRVTVLYELMEQNPQAYETLSIKSREVWHSATPSVHLTWRMELTGDNFIAKARFYGAFQTPQSILEIGPGYGRLLSSILNWKLPFKKYTGLDISPNNVSFLQKKFGNDKICFIQGDADNAKLNDKFDVVISSLTFKHLYPTFEKALVNITSSVNPGGKFVFDLMEGERTFVERDTNAYSRQYTKPKVLKILENCGLKLVAFDNVEHARTLSRLLVVAEKP